MEARFINGSSVSRVYSDGTGELVAAFQYECDAVKFAEQKIAEDAARDFKSDYVVACSLTGNVKVFRPTVKATSKAA